MKWMKTLALFLFLVVLAIYVYFYEIKGGEKREKVKEEAGQVFNFETDSVTALEIRSIMSPFYFRKESDQWLILNPIQTDAEKSTITSALNTLKNLKKEREFNIRKNELNSYGLVGTSTLVILQLSNGKRDSIRFGDETPVGSNAFANKADSVVFMVPSSAKQNFIKTLFDWREKSVTRVKQADIKEFYLKNPQGSFHLVKEGNDWQLKTPLQTRADNTTVSSILSKMEYGKANAVASESFDNPEQYRLQKPVYQLDMLIGESKAQKSVILSDLKDNLAYAKDMTRSPVFTIDSLFIKEINKSLFQLRNKKISEFDRDGADSIVVTQGDSMFTFRKDTSATWFMDGTQKVKGWKINSLLNTLNNLSAKKFLQENVASTSQYGLSRPERKINIFRRGEKILEIFLAAPRTDLKVAFSPNSGIVAEVEESAYSNMKIVASEFREEPVDLNQETD